jgi:hypothetical protein
VEAVSLLRRFVVVTSVTTFLSTHRLFKRQNAFFILAFVALESYLKRVQLGPEQIYLTHGAQAHGEKQGKL